ncbi:ComEA family DNA-binding protein [Dyadobacter subterraneus]|uniref:Helix-hairpin-helix domain-containing protein n=1 Tax=Dyadobacter subterraneus TaxID=2773304 RepID=A0ABR9W6A3_9BACT|nr:helix-hairpin-helix domain-containing protein [Dyadobacter subterraneus]MBE9460973.1 helix-hairpin-helix domain-containing protein [Dyadobacter subterraneus]
MLRRILDQLEDFFGISRKQARAAFVLMFLSFFLIWTPFILRRWILPLFPTSSEPVDTQKLDSIAAQLEQDAALQEEENESKYSKKEYSKTLAKPVHLFFFDPNTASVDQLEELGIPAFIAKRIDKYRSKGGKFRKKEDLLNIYDFPSDVYQKLESYIKLPELSSAFPKSKYPEKTYSNNSLPKEVKAYNKPLIVPFDINTTDTTQLIKLKGIGSKLSLRILKFRDGLGGFHSTSQFSEIFGLDSLALTELNKYAKIQSPVKKININTATAEELGQHSYLRNKKINSVIINYRTQHGAYQSLEDLKKVRVLDEKVIEKIGPYLVF